MDPIAFGPGSSGGAPTGGRMRRAWARLASTAPTRRPPGAAATVVHAPSARDNVTSSAPVGR